MGHTGIAITPGYDSRYGDTAFGKSCVHYGAHDVRSYQCFLIIQKGGHLKFLKEKRLGARFLQRFTT